jgi:hypothetical protein
MRRSYRLGVTVSHEMTVALEILCAKSGLAMTTQAMVILRQGLDRTIQTDACQLRIRQDAAFRTRDQWLQDTQTDTFVSNALAAAEGDATDAPPA